MSRFETFKPKSFSPDHLTVIRKANEIIESYQADGYDLTLRQLYYQFVARDCFPHSWLREVASGKTVPQMTAALRKNNTPESEIKATLAQFQWTVNTERNYKNLGNVLNDARYAGEIDWHAIVDRTREITEWQHYDGPGAAVKHALDHYAIDMWENQPTRVELWVEKEALAGVFHRVCMKWDVPFLSCRGYVSASSAFQAFERVEDHPDQDTIILHFGDHDPSGIDMTRDNEDRLELFNNGPVEIRRLALNMDQVREHNPPPAPAKITDSRAGDYIDRFGEDSWELDALNPDTLVKLVESELRNIIDPDIWEDDEARFRDDRRKLRDIISSL